MKDFKEAVNKVVNLRGELQIEALLLLASYCTDRKDWQSANCYFKKAQARAECEHRDDEITNKKLLEVAQEIVCVKDGKKIVKDIQKIQSKITEQRNDAYKTVCTIVQQACEDAAFNPLQASLLLFKCKELLLLYLQGGFLCKDYKYAIDCIINYIPADGKTDYEIRFVLDRLYELSQVANGETAYANDVAQNSNNKNDKEKTTEAIKLLAKINSLNGRAQDCLDSNNNSDGEGVVEDLESCREAIIELVPDVKDMLTEKRDIKKTVSVMMEIVTQYLRERNLFVIPNLNRVR